MDIWMKTSSCQFPKDFALTGLKIKYANFESHYTVLNNPHVSGTIVYISLVEPLK